MALFSTQALCLTNTAGVPYLTFPPVPNIVARRNQGMRCSMSSIACEQPNCSPCTECVSSTQHDLPQGYDKLEAVVPHVLMHGISTFKPRMQRAPEAYCRDEHPYFSAIDGQTMLQPYNTISQRHPTERQTPCQSPKSAVGKRVDCM
jgi:hypothetical protein